MLSLLATIIFKSNVWCAVICAAFPNISLVLVNSTRLGIESAAQIIGWAVRTKQQFAELGAPPAAPDGPGA